jgi:hypothetical protein
MCGNAGLVGCPIRAKRAMIRLFARMDPEVRPEVRSLCGSICASVQGCESQANVGHSFTISTWTACPCPIGSRIERGVCRNEAGQGLSSERATQIVRGDHESSQTTHNCSAGRNTACLHREVSCVSPARVSGLLQSRKTCRRERWHLMRNHHADQALVLRAL